MTDETTVAEETTTEETAATEVEHDIETQRGRLCAAIEQHGPGQRTVREFHRSVRAHVRGVTGSYHAVAGYVEGSRPIPEKFLEAAAKVLGPVTASWLKHGDNPPEGELELEEDEDGTQPVVEANDPYADIRNTVTQAGRKPSDEALQALDPKYPRRGQTMRNWQILHALVGGRAAAEIAAEVGLSESRVLQIAEEYSGLVRAAAGLDV